MRVLKQTYRLSIGQLLLTLVFSSLLLSCEDNEKWQEIDTLNDKAYHFHYISLDSTIIYSNAALRKSVHYDAGRNEAMNNLAFADIIKMNFKEAEKKLNDILNSTDNRIELLVANTQMMRICQRQSRNKEFYDYYWKATLNLNRINEERSSLTERQLKRVNYAETEMKIVLSAYLFYVGQIDSSMAALDGIDENSDIQKDTAQLLNYFYNIGSGEYPTRGSAIERNQKEFDYLIRCYFIALRGKYIFWKANALQAMSEHLQNAELRDKLIEMNYPAMKAINVGNVDSYFIAGNLAQRSLEAFEKYGDVYQTAGALRTLSDCYFQIGDFHSAVDCLNEAILRDSLINQSPSLRSSLYEKLSINYSALNDKQKSDFNRNLYLDTQENTRQDRELEARAEQLEKVSFQLNLMIIGVFVGIILLVALLVVFTKKRREKEKCYTSESLLEPLNAWKTKETLNTEEIIRRQEDIEERRKTAEFSLEQNLHKNIEQRAKMSLINSITPLIDRMLAEIHYLKSRNENEKIRAERYEYILELTDKINEYNNILTDWIQLRKGELNLHIESFRLQELFDIIAGGRSAFAMKNVKLEVTDTKAVVKADKTLTLFMINTMADNARKATEADGTVKIYADETDDFVEIAIQDNGAGMDEEQLQNVFNHQPSVKLQHGFGLMNCKGIIEKYKKMSQMFVVCSISAGSKKGKGSLFKFRLPHGILRICIGLLSLFTSLTASAANLPETETKIKMYADSAYFCNLQGRYDNTIKFAKLTCAYLNKYYREIVLNGKDTIKLKGSSIEQAAELKWFSDSLPMRYDVILDMRNETAVAALALHDWDLYNYNNSIYIRLFRESSADHSLADYVQQTQMIRNTKNVAIIMLVLILLSIIPAYYMLYYRHMVYYRSLVDKVNKINLILFEDISEAKKLEKINLLWQKSKNMRYALTKETSNLNDVVVKICNALTTSMQIKQKDYDEIEFAEDELKRLDYETQRLYINNNVLDNCFSTLKHETMYYPSRIRQIIEDRQSDISALSEITHYYKDLYAMLSMQAQSQVDRNLKVNSKLFAYLRYLILKLSAEETPVINKFAVDKYYNSYTIEYKKLELNEQQTSNLFTPLTSNLLTLQIRQIIREIGEVTGRRGCGVQANKREGGGTEVVITLYNKIDLGF